MKRRKTDAVDAEAICEAVRRSTMRFVEIKTEDQQALRAVHRTRDLVVRQRPQIADMIRGLLREFGHVLPTGVEAITRFSKHHVEGDYPDIEAAILSANQDRFGRKGAFLNMVALTHKTSDRENRSKSKPGNTAKGRRKGELNFKKGHQNIVFYGKMPEYLFAPQTIDEGPRAHAE